mgnify:FL=1
MTMNYQIKYTKEFKKSIKKLTKQGKNIDKLLNIVDKLSKGIPLEIKYRDHTLYNDNRFQNCRDCHIEPDWVLIYKYLDENLILLLVNTGSHSEVLEK